MIQCENQEVAPHTQTHTHITEIEIHSFIHSFARILLVQEVRARGYAHAFIYISTSQFDSCQYFII